MSNLIQISLRPIRAYFAVVATVSLAFSFGADAQPKQSVGFDDALDSIIQTFSSRGQITRMQSNSDIRSCANLAGALSSDLEDMARYDFTFLGNGLFVKKAMTACVAQSEGGTLNVEYFPRETVDQLFLGSSQ
ncbi:MAG: hypothetical protein AAFQ15_08540 [Pseudomonadota bacterium]